MTTTDSIFDTDERTNDVFSRSVEPPLVQTGSVVGGAAATLQSVVGSTVVAATLVLYATGLCVTAASSPALTSSVINIDATSRPGLPGWWSHVQKRLTQLQEMLPGWEGSGQPISANSVTALLSFLETAASSRTPRPAVVPLLDGGVRAEWHTGGLDIEVSASREGEVVTYVASLEGDEIEESVSPDSELDGWIDHLLTPTNA